MMNENKYPSQRQLKIGQQIRFFISNLFIKEDFIFEQFSGKDITVVDVVMSSDLKQAKIFISMNPLFDNKSLIRELNRKSNLIKFKISQNLSVKFTPNIKFFYDNSLEYSKNIKDLLENIK